MLKNYSLLILFFNSFSILFSFWSTENFANKLHNFVILCHIIGVEERSHQFQINRRSVSGYEFFKSRNIICMNYVKLFYPQWLAQCIVQSWRSFIHSFHKMLNAFICVRNHFRKQRTVNKQHTSL